MDWKPRICPLILDGARNKQPLGGMGMGLHANHHRGFGVCALGWGSVASVAGGGGSRSSAIGASARSVPNNCRPLSNACDNAVKLMPRRLLHRSCHCSADGFGMALCILSLPQGRNWPKAATGFGMEPY